MPGEGLTHGPRAVKKHGEGTTGSAGSSGIPCATVLRLIARSPRGPGFLAPVISGSSLADLTSASGGQDHMPSPSAPTMLVSHHLRGHRIPASRLVTIAIRPSASEAGCATVLRFFRIGQTNYFCARGFTGLPGWSLICPTGSHGACHTGRDARLLKLRGRSRAQPPWRANGGEPLPDRPGRE